MKEAPWWSAVFSYYTYLISCTAVVIAASGATTVAALLNPLQLAGHLGTLIGEVLTSPFQTAYDILKQAHRGPAIADPADWRLRHRLFHDAFRRRADERRVLSILVRTANETA